nr:Chain B, FP19711 [synthetic construct]
DPAWWVCAIAAIECSDV